jgi:Tfp pilus tip-associated adhesin PilY1
VVDLPDSGERVNVEMKLVLGTLVIGTNVPQDSACSSGGHSWINFLNYNTGLAVDNSPTSVVSQYLADSLIVGLGVIGLPPRAGFNNPTYMTPVQLGNASGISVGIPVATPPPVGKRISWREIAQ